MKNNIEYGKILDKLHPKTDYTVEIETVNRIEAIRKAYEDYEAGHISKDCYKAIFLYNAKKIWGYNEDEQKTT